MSRELTITFEDDGTWAGLYADELLDYYAALGGIRADRIRRASNVEPDPVAGGWKVLLQVWVPGEGLREFGPFPTRQEALDFEVAELRRRGL